MNEPKTSLAFDMNQALEEIGHAISKEIAASDPPSQFSSAVMKAPQYEEQLTTLFKTITETFTQGSDLLFTTLTLLSKSRSEIDIEKIGKELRQAHKHLNKETFYALARQESLDSKFSPENFFHISEETIGCLFDAAAFLMEENKFEDALKAFSLICSLSPGNYDYWLGFGHSAFHCKQYDAAILAYYKATLLNASSPWPLIWAANSAEQKNDIRGSLSLLERSFELCQEASEEDFQGQDIKLQDIKSLQSELKSRIESLKGIS